MAFRQGAATGVIVAGLVVVAMLLLRLLADVPTLPELALDWLTLWLPVAVAAGALGSLGAAAKPLMFALLFLALLAMGGVIGGAVGSLRARRRAPLSVGATGEPAAGAADEQTGEQDGGRRRRLLERVAWGGLTLAGGVGVWRYVRSASAGEAMGSTGGSRGTRRSADGLPAEVTANGDFYKVSKNLADPRIAAPDWRLQILGLVKKPVSLHYEEVLDLRIVHQWQTLECISNDVGGDYIGNAVWSGVRVSDLIERAGGADPKATRAVFYATDGYSDSFPLAKALEPTTLLAAYMNSETLPPEHGYPLRLLVPGVYGMKNVKWVNIVELIDHQFRGYWEQRGWSEAAVVKTTSRIDVPRRGMLRRAEATRIAGIAFAGDRGIDRVEVSDDDGATWRTATLRPPQGLYSWVFWEVPWQPEPGPHRLLVRATDGKGAVQGAGTSPTLPDGAAGYHQVDVRVV